jgi:hypothetical protein
MLVWLRGSVAFAPAVLKGRSSNVSSAQSFCSIFGVPLAGALSSGLSEVVVVVVVGLSGSGPLSALPWTF